MVLEKMTRKGGVITYGWRLAKNENQEGDAFNRGFTVCHQARINEVPPGHEGCRWECFPHRPCSNYRVTGSALSHTAERGQYPGEMTYKTVFAPKPNAF